MSNMLIFSIRDEKANAFLKPFFAPTVDYAIRMLSDLVNEPNHEFQKHAHDYNLFQIGEFDEFKGTLKGIEPFHLGLAATYRQPSPQVSFINEDEEDNG